MSRTEDINAVELVEVSKSFNSTKVVDRISFKVKYGEVFGLIGPNGAGKTTTIRMALDIIKPDSGQISVLGESFCAQIKDMIGYLPEERGLYKKLTIYQSLCYLASLKGVSRHYTRVRSRELLERVNMLAHQNMKIEELSRGMGQLIQFLTTIIHNPRLIILDEPFANLDPVNTELLKQIILELREQGRAIILSTHRMNEIEELCDRIFMINEGCGVLYGALNEIKSRYRRNSIFLEYEGELGDLKGVTVRQDRYGSAELLLEREILPQEVLEQLIHRGIRINRYEISTPPLHDIFLQMVGESSG